MGLNRVFFLTALSTVQCLSPATSPRKQSSLSSLSSPSSISPSKTSLQYQDQEEYQEIGSNNRRKANDPLEEFETNKVDGMPLGTSTESEYSSYDWLAEVEEMDEAGESYAWMLAEGEEEDEEMYDDYQGEETLDDDDDSALLGNEEGEKIYDVYDGQDIAYEVMGSEDEKELTDGDGDEDDSIYPTFELLKEWTMDYMDLVDLAGGGMTRVSVGMQHLMHDAFVFTSPNIGPIGKPDFVNLMAYYNDNGLDLASAIPDLSVSYEGWHQDPDEPWRIWVIARYSGTHLGLATIPESGLKLCPPNENPEKARLTTGPQMESFLWTPDRKILWQSMGYVGDEHTGSNAGYGGLDGLLVSMGLPYLYLQATNPVRDVFNWLSQFRGEDIPKTKSPYSRLPQWWHERKKYNWNVNR
jgi:hypothetical protein